MKKNYSKRRKKMMKEFRLAVQDGILNTGAAWALPNRQWNCLLNQMIKELELNKL